MLHAGHLLDGAQARFVVDDVRPRLAGPHDRREVGLILGPRSLERRGARDSGDSADHKSERPSRFCICLAHSCDGAQDFVNMAPVRASDRQTRQRGDKSKPVDGCA